MVTGGADDEDFSSRRTGFGNGNSRCGMGEIDHRIAGRKSRRQVIPDIGRGCQGEKRIGMGTLYKSLSHPAA
jgi:hypothetical protein